MSKLTLLLSKLIPNKLERGIRTFRDKNLRKYQLENLPQEIFEEKYEPYSISFCTTCMNRLFHLKHTIEQNIKSNANYPKVEFVLVNYNSQDGLDDWVKENLQSYIDSGVLNYYATYEPQFFHASKAKNLAHKLAKGEIVCNLDGDNYTGDNFAYYINYLYHKNGLNTVLHFRKPPYWGTEGRIVYTKEKFMELGGHDERLMPTGHEDHDLLNRAKAHGLTYVENQIENFLKYLSNSTKEKSSNFEDENAYYYDYETANRNKSNQNIEEGILEANQGIDWGKAKIYKNFSKEAFEL